MILKTNLKVFALFNIRKYKLSEILKTTIKYLFFDFKLHIVNFLHVHNLKCSNLYWKPGFKLLRFLVKQSVFVAPNKMLKYTFNLGFSICSKLSALNVKIMTPCNAKKIEAKRKREDCYILHIKPVLLYTNYTQIQESLSCHILTPSCRWSIENMDTFVHYVCIVQCTVHR